MPSEPPSGPPWTVLKILRWTTAYFQNLFQENQGLDNPRVDAELLLSHTLGCRRLDLYLRYDQPLNENELARYRHLVKRRAACEPVAYILGQKEFWSLALKVTPDVLIPRPDTECLVETVLDVLATRPVDHHPRMLELGVGSGAVSIALATEQPDLHIVATDISETAVAVARHNARCHGVADRIDFIVGNWMELFCRKKGSLDLIVSNPPYIATADLAGLSPDINRHEPILALDGGKDGIQCLIHLMRTAPDYLISGGYLICEMGFDQKQSLEAFARQWPQYDRVEFVKDDAGHDRVVKLRKQDGT